VVDMNNKTIGWHVYETIGIGIVNPRAVKFTKEIKFYYLCG